MKFHILSDLKEGPWGGGNQFQKALKRRLMSLHQYTEDINSADVVIANSHHWNGKLTRLYRAKKSNPNMIILHRIDGPISVVREGMCQLLADRAVMSFSKMFADGIVYQSLWSKEQCEKYMGAFGIPNAIIHNAPDPELFFRNGIRKKTKGKVRLVASSWSSNKRKGNDIYQLLDKELDFSKYEFTFIGNSSVKFKNTKHIPSMSSNSLAQELQKHDLFIHPSHMESCSNSLIEAMHCGLVPIMRDNTSHPEIAEYGGILFQGKSDIFSAIDTVSRDIDLFRDKLSPPSMDDISSLYVGFSKTILKTRKMNARKINACLLVFPWLNWAIMRQCERVWTRILRKKHG